MVESGKKHFPVLFSGNMAQLMNGTIEISFQMKGTEFSVIHGLEKPKLLHTGTCTPTWTRHVN